jgi:uncharacterized FlgJ-related protein
MSDRDYNSKFSPNDQTDIEDLIEYYRRDMKAGSRIAVTFCGIKMVAKIVAIPESDQMTLQFLPLPKGWQVLTF